MVPPAGAASSVMRLNSQCLRFAFAHSEAPLISLRGQNTDGLLKHANLTGLHGRSSSDFRGARVLIPLCGDTPALRFFAELGCHVTGVELVQSVRLFGRFSLQPPA